jgi:DNA replication licensing factor MCM6
VSANVGVSGRVSAPFTFSLSTMDVDMPSSSGLGPRSSLPPSSVPLATQNSESTPHSRQTRTVDPLALYDASEAEEDNDGASSRRRPKGRNQRAGEVPPVKDATGEKVMESFELFLKT